MLIFWGRVILTEYMKKLFVGGLPFKYGDQDLAALFAPFGQVISAKIIIDRAMNRSKGFGFVEMNGADADKAIATLDGSDLEGRSLVVNEARPMVPRDTRN